MIKIRNHLGTITISGKYLVKLVTDQVESCFGVSGLESVEILPRRDGLAVKLHVLAAGDVNVPAVSDAVSHKVAYVLANKTGAQLSAVDIYIDSLA